MGTTIDQCPTCELTRHDALCPRCDELAWDMREDEIMQLLEREAEGDK